MQTTESRAGSNLCTLNSALNRWRVRQDRDTTKSLVVECPLGLHNVGPWSLIRSVGDPLDCTTSRMAAAETRKPIDKLLDRLITGVQSYPLSSSAPTVHRLCRARVCNKEHIYRYVTSRDWLRAILWPWSTVRLGRSIRLVATGDQWSGPISFVRSTGFPL